MDGFEIGDRAVGPDESTYVIAEAGSNHNGDLEIAKELIDVAADAGADAVKFQTFRAEDMYVEDSGEVEYLDDDRSIYDIIESMEMPYEWIPTLHDYCYDRGVQFLSTPFDERSAAELEDYVPAWKVASYTSSHVPFLEHLAATDKPIVMSTGAHDLEEIAESVTALKEAGADELALLQCVAAYPTPLSEINVRVVETLREKFGVPAGLSDHTLDPVTAPSAAVALGASVVEKHFTLDKSMEGPDHEFALEPDELERMVSSIRDTESALGTGEKRVLDAEEELHDKARRAIHAVDDIDAGDPLTTDNVKVLRPGEREPGLEPKFYEEVVGSVAARDLRPGKGITWEDVDD
ncbi:N-acetylneuraminate synthase family protein [Halopiger xanaduensis]|uniref:N-acetylneuraminate synthase n=1 Tax=Halopiger xanaduensis (strain DSM 18323 / JCM 14033 / SH-6) TaxID=797210 RepID=F8DAP6_HALXS|nr:N-acetylneuraminate synthase family protein [Halopiger xanaduensis]AEH36988.1 N-acetylneuraminate synthase [Halopiger xanaduensis SH-6]